MMDKIKATFKEQLFSTIIHVNVKLKEAQNEGTHILKYDKYSRGTKDYYSLSREVIMQEKFTQVMPVLQERMEQILKEELPKINKANFTVFAPEAKEVYLVGEFNDWKIDPASRMEKENGTWRKNVSITPGSYRYRFVIDGIWTEDPANPQKAQNPYGQMDSLVEV
jgi:hypothetical protein